MSQTGDLFSSLPVRRSWLVPAILLLISATLILPTAESLHAQVLVRLQDQGKDLEAYDLLEDEDTGVVWIASNRGLFFSADGNAVTRRPAEDRVEREIYSITKYERPGAGDAVFLLGARDGLFVITREAYRRVSAQGVDGSPVYDVLADANGDLWLATSKGVGRLRAPGGDLAAAQGLVVEPHLSGPSRIQIVEGDIWAMTLGDVSVWDRNQERFKGLDPAGEIPNVVEVHAWNGQYYLRSFGSTLDSVSESLFYRWSPGGEPLPHGGRGNLEILEKGILDIALMGEKIWLSKGGVIYTETGPTGLVRRDFLDESQEVFYLMGETDHHQWLISHDRIYRRDLRETGGGEFRPLAMMSHKFDRIRGVTQSRQGVWIWGPSGLFRVQERVVMVPDLNTFSFFGLEMVWGDRIEISKVQYKLDSNTWKRPGGGKTSFQGILHSDPARFEGRIKEMAFNDISEESHAANSMTPSVQIAVRDGNGSFQRADAPRGMLVLSRSAWEGLKWFFTLFIIPISVFALIAFIPLRSGWRLWAFFLLVERYPVTSWVLSPSWAAVRSQLRRLYRLDRQRSRLGMVAEVNQELLDGVARRLEAPGVVTLTPAELGGASIDDLELYAACQEEGIFADSFPIAGDFTSFGPSTSPDDIEKAVLKALERDIRHSTPSFCAALLKQGEFVFIFALERGNESVERAIRSFYDHTKRRENYLILVEVAPGGPRES